MEWPNMHAHTYEDTHTHTQTQKVGKVEREKKNQQKRGVLQGRKKEKRKEHKEKRGAKKKGTREKMGGGEEKERKSEGCGFRWVEESGNWGEEDFILITQDRHELFFITCKGTNKANNATHYVKLGKKRRKNSKRNYYINLHGW